MKDQNRLIAHLLRRASFGSTIDQIETYSSIGYEETVKDLLEIKGKKKLVEILVKNVEEASAAEKVGFEMLATGTAGKYTNPDNHPSSFKELIAIRNAAPSAFMHYAPSDTHYSSIEEATRLAFKALE